MGGCEVMWEYDEPKGWLLFSRSTVVIQGYTRNSHHGRHREGERNGRNTRLSHASSENTNLRSPATLDEQQQQQQQQVPRSLGSTVDNTIT